MKVVFVITGLVAGGAENMLLKLLLNGPHLKNATVITLKAGGDLLPRFQAAGIRVETLNMHPGRPNPLAIWRLARRLRALNADVVSTWMYHADLIGGLAARLAGIPVAWGIRNSAVDERLTSRATRAVVKLCGRLSRFVPDAIISCSVRARDIHVAEHYASDKFCLIQNGFDLDAFKPDLEARLSLRTELGLAADVPLAGMIARYSPQKNHAGFLAAAAQVLQQCPAQHFLLAGLDAGPDNAELAALIRAYGLEGRVHCLGLRQDVPRITAALDLACLSSIFGEAFPNVLGEALACGVPCVATDVGDSESIVGDCGRVVVPGDVAAFAGAMQAMLTLPAAERVRMALRARQRMLDGFEIRHVASLYEEIFEHLAHLRQA
ncbi:glycosyltransferase [Uliginosibacterium sp. 31-16]|uniref:glycosyltransferase n=1 Tax=Uliginosibacterium sp. 31-16 TaxID=3068315 RepID=UPI00273E8431|nr:glycosyltransferase [Uliginosibacterium sp. 31-16]MDP5238379.1 glycosyltransferase [Uliginosibacterium sp. 31-16]